MIDRETEIMYITMTKRIGLHIFLICKKKLLQLKQLQN